VAPAKEKHLDSKWDIRHAGNMPMEVKMP